MKKLISKYKIINIIVIIIVITFPFAVVLGTLITGNIDFGYDHSRDFIQGLNNLQKISLIGSTTGIPGIFYGPYWIWLLSFGLLFSQDPRIVVFIILTIPYFTIFPYILFKFKNIFGFWGCIILWLLFIFSTGMRYATSPWNPNPAPLLFLLIVYHMTFTDFTEYKKNSYLKALIVGVVAGIILNIHISFGLGVALGIVLYMIVSFIREFLLNKNFKDKLMARGLIIGSFIVGNALAFTPYLLFEIRHGFNQIKTALLVLSSESPVVGVTGLSDELILKSLFGTMQTFLKMPEGLTYLMFVGILIFIGYQLTKKRVKLKEIEIRLSILLFSVLVSVLFLYLGSKNPVWSYHFIGVELIFLLFFGLVIGKSKKMKYLLGVWLIILLISNSSHLLGSFNQDPYQNSASLATEEYIVRLIVKDAGGHDYNVFAYSPSIYSYEYSYLFKWIANRDIPYDPGMNKKNSAIVYLIIPPTSNAIKQNFINYRTPKYLTVVHWSVQDGTEIVKRKRIQ